MEILQTNSYDQFESITGNRPLNIKKVEKICADIDGGLNMLPYYPIIVSRKDDKFYIIDGQHRHEVSRRTGHPVYYVTCETLSLKQIALLNSRGEKWKASDFLNCYIKLGIEDYVRLQEVINQFAMPFTTACDLLMVNYVKGRTTEAFQSGEFKCHYYDETIQLLTLVNDIFGRYIFSKDKNLIAAVQTIQKKGKCDFERLKAKIKAAPMMMDKQGNPKNYVYNIERVYNFKSQTREYIM